MAPQFTEVSIMPVARGRKGVQQEMRKYKAGELHSGSKKGPFNSMVASGYAIAPGLCRFMDRLAIKRLNMKKRTWRKELGHMLGEIA